MPTWIALASFLAGAMVPAGAPAAPAEEPKGSQARGDSLADQARKLEGIEQQLRSMQRSLDSLSALVPGPGTRQVLEDRLRRLEEATQRIPELPPDTVAAGEFPGSIRVPGTDAAIKFGGRIRVALAFTLDPLGSTDRFLTNSIPVATAAAGEAKRTTFSANTSRLNLEMRTPAGAAQMRAFVEGDFFGKSGDSSNRTNFRMRHAYAQYRRVLGGQTWSTFSDPALNFEDLDQEGMNSENVIRQAQLRVTWQLRHEVSLAVAAETPEVSLTGGQGVNLVPDLVARLMRSLRRTGHLQAAVVLRQIRGEPDSLPGTVKGVFAWGGSLSGAVPVAFEKISDRFLYQVNFGRGNARYINDLNSMGGQDAVFNTAGTDLEALPTVGWFLDYEHQWARWKRTQEMRLRSSVIWGYVAVENVGYQPGGAYHRTDRYSVNLVFSPNPRIDTGVEFIHGTRENRDGHRRSANQIQLVSIYRF